MSQEVEGSFYTMGGARFMRPWTDLRLRDLRKVFGPAWLVMMADVDAASIITAMQTGASFKYEFIIILLLLIIPLYFICEIAGRVGSVTKKGLSSRTWLCGPPSHR
ncbi:MAG TPA: hypothetical protein VGZ23_16165 [bacterium]|nr:hypothetical protein [bacterium]